MKTYSICCFCFLIFICGNLCHAQTSVQQLERYLKQISADNTTPIPPVILSDFQAEKALLENLFRHRADPGEQFQFRVLDLIRLIGLKSKNQAVRSSAVNHFVNSIGDQNLRISGLASQSAAQFLRPDFSQQNQDSIVSYLRVGMPNLDILFRLSGFLEIPAAREKISSMLILPMSPTLKWNARLALARLGDQSATDFVLEKAGTTPVDDAFVSGLIPGLVYTRNKKVFAHLEKILQDDSFRCSSSHPASTTTVLCAYRILESMASVIDKFPVKVDDSGDLIVDSYQSGLETARKWFKQNPNYSINRNTL